MRKFNNETIINYSQGKKKLNAVRIVLELLAPEVEELNFLRRRFLSFTLSFSSTLLDGFLILRKRETLISELL